jgi:hypothetical protein
MRCETSVHGVGVSLGDRQQWLLLLDYAKCPITATVFLHSDLTAHEFAPWKDSGTTHCQGQGLMRCPTDPRIRSVSATDKMERQAISKYPRNSIWQGTEAEKAHAVSFLVSEVQWVNAQGRASSCLGPLTPGDLVVSPEQEGCYRYFLSPYRQLTSVFDGCGFFFYPGSTYTIPSSIHCFYSTCLSTTSFQFQVLLPLFLNWSDCTSCNSMARTFAMRRHPDTHPCFGPC